MKLSKEALELLQTLFSEKSTLQIPAGIAAQVVEIKNWAEEELKNGSKQSV